jgi:hypothetical protein
MNDQIESKLLKIAQDTLGIKSLKTRSSDGLDFHDIAVWRIKDALAAAFQAGTDCATNPKRVIDADTTGDDYLHDLNRQRTERRSVLRSKVNQLDSREKLVQSLCDDALIAFGQALNHRFPGENHRFISPLTTLCLLDATKAAIDEWLSANFPTMKTS